MRYMASSEILHSKLAHPPRRQQRVGTQLMMANEPAWGLRQRGSAGRGGEVFATAPSRQLKWRLLALDSSRRCPAPPGLMDSVRSVKAREWSKNACMSAELYVICEGDQRVC